MKLKKVLPVIALLTVLVTGCNKKDEFHGVPPRVISTDPISNAVGIDVRKSISALFSSEMDPLTLTTDNFILMKGTEVVQGTVIYSDSVAIFNPTSDLSENTTYEVRISLGAKTTDDLGLEKEYKWSFATGVLPDVTSPTVTLTDPLNDATAVAINKSVEVTFSEAMNPSSITSLTFTLKQGSTFVAGAITYTGTKATFLPSSNLAYSKVYTGTVTTGARDLEGNALASNHTFSFTTINDNSMPATVSNQPLSNAISVERNKVLVVDFSEPMDQSTINTSTFTLMDGSVLIPGTVTYSGTTAVFTPASYLDANKLYTATITTGVKDLAGNALAQNLVWTFTTAATSQTLGPVVLGAAANYVILAKTTITNIPTSAITGDMGLSPAATSYITGFSLTNQTGYATSTQVTGKIYAADMAEPTGVNLTTAVENMITAYNDAAGRLIPDFLELGTGNIGGKTLVPGLYKWTNTVTIPADITISGGANDIWIFQISQDLTVSSGVNIILSGGAQAKNIFWQVAGTATFGTTSHFEGIVLSMTGITFQTGASFKGRALAQTAVVLDKNAIILP